MKMNNNFYQMNEIDNQKYRREQEIAYFEKLLGDNFLKLLKDSFITEIMLNNDEEKHLWIDKFGEGLVETNITVNNVEALKIIENVANLNKKVINDENPILSGSLPNGERFEAIIGECVNFSPIMAIRKPPTQIFTLDQYVEKNVITAKQKDFIIHKFINERKNILIVGGTSSGKTTLANACLEQLTNTKDRIVIIEDTQELQCKARNIVRLKSTYKILTSVLLKSTMRLNPTRVMIGEARDGQTCLDFLMALNSGHPGGLVTVHADSAELGLKKVGQYINMVSQKPQEEMIASAFDIIVFIERDENQNRKIKEVLYLEGWDEVNKKYILTSVAS